MKNIVVGAQMREHDALLKQLVDCRFASRLGQGDAQLWGADAVADATERLGWVDVFSRADGIVREAEALRADFHARGLHRVVLSGMGGSSLAPESITHHDGVPLFVLDSTHPEQVRAALADLDHTVLVVSSKSGSTVETRSHLAAFETAFRDANIDPAKRIVVVTDPGSQLESDARGTGYRVFLADPNVGGRYSALTAFGLVPSVLAGADGARLVAEARACWDVLTTDSADNPALQLGAVLAAQLPRDCTFGVTSADVTLRQLGAWVEQLIAESTGKHGRGVLPIHLGPDAPEVKRALSGEMLPPHTFLVFLDASEPDAQDALDIQGAQDAPGASSVPGRSVSVSGALGAQFLLWSVATVALCRLIDVNPFDQPDVESAKVAARKALERSRGDGRPAALVETVGAADAAPDAGVATSWDAGVAGVTDVVDVLREAVTEDCYVAVHAYVDSAMGAACAQLRDAVFEAFEVPVSLGVGPRFLHSTGQLHKGGPKRGIFIQIVDADANELPIPGTGYGFAALMRSQASGDREMLLRQGRPIVTISAESVDRLIAELRMLNA